MRKPAVRPAATRAGKEPRQQSSSKRVQKAHKPTMYESLYQGMMDPEHKKGVVNSLRKQYP